MNPHAHVIRLDVPCKRCDDEGCGGSWVSDCMSYLPPSLVLQKVEEILLSINQQRNRSEPKSVDLETNEKLPLLNHHPFFTLEKGSLE